MILSLLVRKVTAFLGAFFLMYNVYAVEPNKSEVISFYELRDFELENSPNKSHAGVFSVFDTTVTMAGKECLARNLMNVTSDVGTIMQKQDLVRYLKDNPEALEYLQALLASAHEYEDDARYFIQQQEDGMAHNVIENFYFTSKIFKKFNDSEYALTAKRTLQYVGLFGPVVEHLIFHFALEHIQHSLKKSHHHHAHHGHNHKPGEKCSHHLTPSPHASPWVKRGFMVLNAAHLGVHLLNVKDLVEHCHVQTQLINTLHKKIIRTHKWLCAASSIAQEMENNTAQHPALRQLLAAYSGDACEHLGVLSMAGKTLKQYKLLQQNTEHLRALEQVVGDVDALVSVAKWVKNTKERGGNVCFVTFSESEKPVIAMNNFWHPMLDAATVTCNSCQLGGDGHRYSIITGPNKAGKSTVIKAIGVNSILAQTYGIAAAESCTMTPFHKIISNITVADDLAHDSSMMVAEMARAQHCIDTLKALKSHEYACVIIDDSLFKGTAFDLGQKIAYSFIQELGQFNNSCGLIATHVPCLTELGTVQPKIFKNYQIPLVEHEGKKVSSFTLMPGIADARQVLELVKTKF